MRQTNGRRAKYMSRLWPSEDGERILAGTKIPSVEQYPYDAPDFVTFLAVEDSGDIIRRVNFEVRH